MNSKTQNDKPSRNTRGALVALLVITTIGLAASLYLSVLHYQVYNVPDHVSFCAVSDTFNCDTVALSHYSVFAGLPISTWGALYFIMFSALIVWGLNRKSSYWPWSLLALLNGSAIMFSHYLFWISKFQIQAFCILCIAVWIVNLTSGLLIGFTLWRRGVAFLLAFLFLVGGFQLGDQLTLAFFSDAVPPDHHLKYALIAFVAYLVPTLFLARLNGLKKLWAFTWSDLSTLMMHRKITFSFALAGTLCLASLLIITPRLYPQASEPAVKGPAGLTVGETEAGHPWIGAKNPKLVITEYSDYECPFCRKAHQIVRRVVAKRQDWVRLIHIHYPLDHHCNPAIRRPFHQNACQCALAAVCAQEQSKFWEMNDVLYEHSCKLQTGQMIAFAGRLGMNEEIFTQCLNAPRARTRLNRDLQECQGVDAACKQQGKRLATPTFKVGDQLVIGVQEEAWWEWVLNKIETELNPPPDSPK